MPTKGKPRHPTAREGKREKVFKIIQNTHREILIGLNVFRNAKYRALPLPANSLQEVVRYIKDRMNDRTLAIKQAEKKLKSTTVPWERDPLEKGLCEGRKLQDADRNFLECLKKSPDNPTKWEPPIPDECNHPAWAYIQLLFESLPDLYRRAGRADLLVKLPRALPKPVTFPEYSAAEKIYPRNPSDPTDLPGRENRLKPRRQEYDSQCEDLARIFSANETEIEREMQPLKTVLPAKRSRRTGQRKAKARGHKGSESQRKFEEKPLPRNEITLDEGTFRVNGNPLELGAEAEEFLKKGYKAGGVWTPSSVRKIEDKEHQLLRRIRAVLAEHLIATEPKKLAREMLKVKNNKVHFKFRPPLTMTGGQ